MAESQPVGAGKISRRAIVAGAVAVSAAASAGAWIVGRRRGRPGPSVVSITATVDKRIVTANGLPGHAVGDFPSAHDPIAIRPQRHRLELPGHPEVAEDPTPLDMWLFGIAINGVPFDPSGPFWKGDTASGWQFEVLHPANAVALGIDVNRAHTQGRGMYHYHGLPTGLLWTRTAADPDVPMQLLGYAADGFPIYGPECPADPSDLGSPRRRLRPSYRVRGGRRHDGPPGRHDGRFVQDFAYDPGHGNLDECNGRTGPTPEFPDGTYYYVLTDDFPFVPRLYRGRPDPSFRHGPPPGVSPPLPAELRGDVVEA